MSEKVTLSPGEKLILVMLCDLYEQLPLKNEINTKLIREAVYSGNLWGLEWGMSGVFHGEETPEEMVRETTHILSMWQRLEYSYDNLPQADKDWLGSTGNLYGEGVRFPGFDGNGESGYIGAARFLVQELDHYPRFKDRTDLNAHAPTLEMHRRMLEVFDPILHEVLNRDLTASQIAEVLAARRSSRAAVKHA